MIRLIAFDLDGTTILEHRYLSERNRQALLRAHRQGAALMPATGRMRDFVPEVIRTLPGVRFIITSNGAAVYEPEGGPPVYERLIPNEKALQVLALLSRYDVYLEYYRDGRAITKTGYPQLARSHFHLPERKMMFIEGKDYSFTDDLTQFLQTTGLCPEKINLPYLPPALRPVIWAELEALGGLALSSSIGDNIEINARGADKGAAVLAMAERLGLAPEEVMTVGDNGNDLTMLRAVPCSVAVADGSPEALAAARHLTGPHDRDGLADAIERFVLEKAE